MTTYTLVEQAARALLDRCEQRVAGQPLTNEWQGLDVETAFAVQDEILRLRVEPPRRTRDRLHHGARRRELAVAQALAAAANDLAKRGHTLPEGWLVLTGGMTDAVGLNEGSVVSATFNALGCVNISGWRCSRPPLDLMTLTCCYRSAGPTEKGVHT